MSSLGKFKSRWSNYDIRNWSVAVKKNIPRQKDAYELFYDSVSNVLFYDFVSNINGNQLMF